MKHEVHVFCQANVELLIVTSRVPAFAPGSIEMFAVMSVGEFTVVELTVMPVPENERESPALKSEPVMSTSRFWVPIAALFGLTPSVLPPPPMNGADWIVKSESPVVLSAQPPRNLPVPSSWWQAED